ncbi:MAG TPA: FAD-dependent oxidoreductase [Jatrophihabitans sp.]|nr:FAD-dependent oxidoreductase [Jatrophihabitans sp.]
MPAEAPVVIVGGGLMGAGSAWALTRRGVPVIVLEQFGPGHDRGSSHGSARIVRRAYGDGLYVALTGKAFELWREVELASGSTVLRILGGLDFGVRRDVPRVAADLAAAGVEHEVLPAAEAEARWPGMAFEGDVVYHPQGGTMDAAGAVRAMLDLAAAGGADIRHEVPVAAVRRPSAVELQDGSVVDARCVVVAAGGWVGPLVGDLVRLPPLRVTEQSIWHFPRLDPAAPPWPSVIHKGQQRDVYHLAGGRDGGPGDDRKIGDHGSDRDTTAATRDGRIDPAAEQRIAEYVRRWLPGLDPTPRKASTCLYTRTPTEDFVLDRDGDVVICSPCSGHGAKFAPLVGEFVADMITGRGETVPDRFRLAAHAAGRTGAVSL